MAVYERTYRRYTGALTPERARILVFPRYAYEQVFRSKLFLAFFVLCFVYPFALASWLYLPHNLGFIEALGADPAEFAGFFPTFEAGWWYRWFMMPHGTFAFLIAFVLGPALISADMRNNGLALYFSRPISRTDYVLGKMCVLVILLSAVTWIPGMLLFAFQSYLGGLEWLRPNLRVGLAIFLGCWIWILVLCLLSLSISAYVKWRPVARIMLLVVMFMVPAFATMLNLAMRTTWAYVIDISSMTSRIWAGLFGVRSPIDVPAWAAWCVVLAFCAIFVALLARKLRPYEVVR